MADQVPTFPAGHATRDGERTIYYFVPGVPRPQGSKKHVGNGRMVEMSKELPRWRTAVATATMAATASHFMREPFTVARLDLLFVMPRPKIHMSARGGIKPRYVQALHTVTPDIDKLVRAVNDGLVTGGILEDDARVWYLHAMKMYTGESPNTINPGVWVTIRGRRPA